MCEQCLTEAVSVSYHREPWYRRALNRMTGREPVFYYIAIATKEFDTFEAGDVLIGQINNPDMILSDDLFDLEEWTAEDEDETVFDEIRGDTPLEESPLASDRLVYQDEAMNIFHPDYAYPDYGWWKIIPAIIKDFERVFGTPPDSFGRWSWPAWVVVKVAEVFRREGIPYDKAGRLEWAQKKKTEEQA